jgi:5'(3')-deoxyribonucleotidase
MRDIIALSEADPTTKLRVALDMDEVLADWIGEVCRCWNAEYPDEQCTPDAITSWDIAAQLGKGGKSFISGLMGMIGLYRRLKPVDGAINGVNVLLDAGHEVLIVTALPPNAPFAPKEKLEWLAEFMPRVSSGNVFFCNRKELIDADVLVDDRAETIETWTCTGRPAILFDKPHNRECGFGVRAHGWVDVLRIVETLHAAMMVGE